MDMSLPLVAILEDGVKAPSGENCQPWKFRVKENKVSVFNVPEADMSLYNTKQRGSYMAHGALLENISLSARHHGYVASIALFPNPHDETHVADIVFEQGDGVTSLLYDVIHTRCTNRKDFKKETLSDNEKSELVKAVESLSYNTFTIIDNEAHMQALGKALAVHEKVLFENKKMHDFFYDHILWDKADEEKAGGFYIDTLEFLPHQLKAVKLFKNWFLLTCFNALLKVSMMISKENGEKYAFGGAFGVIMMKKGGTSLEYVHMGMTMQRLWLTATKLGIAMHPCNGTLYLMSTIEEYGDKEFAHKHNNIIREAYNVILNTVAPGEKRIGFIFRMGKADSPTAVAKRLPPVIEYSI
jgi:nitroreductase